MIKLKLSDGRWIAERIWLVCRGSLAKQGCSSVEMTDSDGQSIGNIVRLGRLFHFEQMSHHLLHLGFFSSSVSHDRGFNGKRRIFCDLQIVGGRRQHSDSAHVAKL